MKEDAACLNLKNLNEINKNGILDDAWKSLASIADDVDRESLSKEQQPFEKSFNELSKVRWDQYVFHLGSNTWIAQILRLNKKTTNITRDQTAKDVNWRTSKLYDMCM